MRKINVFLIALLTLLSACSTTVRQEINFTNLEELQNLEQGPQRDPSLASQEINAIRVKALQETAMGLAAQGGLAWSTEQINHRLEKDKWNLETIYNFNGMMLTHGVLPPVLVEGDFSLNLEDPNTIRVADRTFKIVEQARFATTPPNWRDYLWMHYTKPEMPARFLLPRNSEEREIWRKAVLLGWEKGVQQSTNIFQQNLARLKRDYKGMLLYRKLLAMKMISAPFVSRTELGVTGDGSDMRVNDQVLRITVLPQLQTESRDWRAIVVKQDE